MSTTINTTIQVRRDTTANWTANKDTIPAAGEPCLDLDTGVVKWGDGVTTYENLKPAGAQASHYEGVRSSGESDNDVIDRVLGTLGALPSKDDVFVIKTLIANGKYSYTAFVYTGTAWAAMDGNYNASNVFFASDITLAGSYDTVGNVSLSDGTLSAAGKSVEDLVTAIFTKELNTGLKTANPSAKIDGTLQYLEIGTSGSVSAAISFDDGSYKYGYTTESVTEDGATPSSTVSSTTVTGAALVTNENAYTVTFNGADTTYASTTTSVTLNSPVKTSKTSMSASIKAKYNAGYAPISNLKKAYPSQAIGAGTTSSATDELFRWYIPWYSGFIYGKDNKLSSADVSKLSKVTGSTAYTASKPTTATATGSWMQYWLIVPKSYNWAMKDAKDSNNLTLSVSTGDNITITYGSGSNTVDVEYNVYYIDNADPYDTVKIQWSL